MSNIHTQNGGDPISSLPIDKNPPKPSEIQIIDTLFKKHKGSMISIATELKEPIIIAILFITFSLPSLNQIIKNFVPLVENSPFILLIVKAIGLAFIFWLIKHFYLSKK